MDLIDKIIEDPMKAPDHNKNIYTNNQKPYVLFYENSTLQLETTLGNTHQVDFTSLNTSTRALFAFDKKG